MPSGRGLSNRVYACETRIATHRQPRVIPRSGHLHLCRWYIESIPLAGENDSQLAAWGARCASEYVIIHLSSLWGASMAIMFQTSCSSAQSLSSLVQNLRLDPHLRFSCWADSIIRLQTDPAFSSDGGAGLLVCLQISCVLDRFADPERVSRLYGSTPQISAIICLVQIVQFA